MRPLPLLQQFVQTLSWVWAPSCSDDAANDEAAVLAGACGIGDENGECGCDGERALAHLWPKRVRRQCRRR